MFEYRISCLTKEQILLLEDEGFLIIEEDFEDFRGYILYSENIDNVLNNFNIKYEKKNIEETNWETKWKEFLKPDLLAKDIYFVFDDEEYDFKKKIKILPALAFGTGTHPTTKIASSLLVDLAEGNSVLDVGCGSAILSIAAEISGAERIISFDIDAIAIKNAKTNIEWNECKKIFLYAGTIDALSEEFKPDILVANIITQVLNSIKNKIYNKRPRYIILSGILQTEYDKFIENFINDKYVVLKKEIMNEWCGVLLSKK
jgi:ribosomal protein L11 methyltransferase